MLPRTSLIPPGTTRVSLPPPPSFCALFVVFTCFFFFARGGLKMRTHPNTQTHNLTHPHTQEYNEPPPPHKRIYTTHPHFCHAAPNTTPPHTCMPCFVVYNPRANFLEAKATESSCRLRKQLQRILTEPPIPTHPTPTHIPSPSSPLESTSAAPPFFCRLYPLFVLSLS